ncbi:cytochrome P450 [Embleya scabrispora]|uniref:cytochrome P450 n=1 Tax=Embleya scabrispora TaxID=159449 RepID=UPI001964650B|nr:cytochrome P450 [Embleya scabrispora]
MSLDADSTAADHAGHELGGYFADLVAERRARPQDDLVSALVRLRDEDPGQAIGDAELIASLVLLLVAGFETTTNLLGNGLALLREHPDVRAALADRSLPVADFVEEVLRYDSPIQLTSRIALRDGLSVDGVPVPRFGEVLMLIGAANRDPVRYREPQRFDPWRAESGSLSFGAGIHFCVGAMLARLEAAVAFPRRADPDHRLTNLDHRPLGADPRRSGWATNAGASDIGHRHTARPSRSSAGVPAGGALVDALVGERRQLWLRGGENLGHEPFEVVVVEPFGLDFGLRMLVHATMLPRDGAVGCHRFRISP